MGSQPIGPPVKTKYFGFRMLSHMDIPTAWMDNIFLGGAEIGNRISRARYMKVFSKNYRMAVALLSTNLTKILYYFFFFYSCKRRRFGGSGDMRSKV